MRYQPIDRDYKQDVIGPIMIKELSIAKWKKSFEYQHFRKQTTDCWRAIAWAEILKQQQLEFHIEFCRMTIGIAEVESDTWIDLVQMEKIIKFWQEDKINNNMKKLLIQTMRKALKIND